MILRVKDYLLISIIGEKTLASHGLKVFFKSVLKVLIDFNLVEFCPFDPVFVSSLIK